MITWRRPNIVMLRARQRIPSNLPDVSRGPLLLALVAGLFLPISDDARTDDTGIPANHRDLSAITELWEPVPRKVTPGVGSAPPDDAIVLFDGTDISQWEPVREGSHG